MQTMCNFTTNRMSNNLVSLAAVAVFTTFCFASSSAALDFSWTFDNDPGGIGSIYNQTGPITGTLTGLSDNTAGQAATTLTITDIGGHTATFVPPLEILGAGWTVQGNSFDVTGGAITGWNFRANNGLDALFMVSGNVGQFRTTPGGFDLTTSPIDGVTFSLIDRNPAVPEPGTMALALLGAAGLASFRWRRRNRIAA